MSELGKLIWKEHKNIFLSGDLLPFSFLAYSYSFRNDYNAIKNPKDRVRLNETLAKVAYLLRKFNGDTNVLRKDPGLQYRKLLTKSGIHRFHVSTDLRISCKFINGNLELRRYGNHDILKRDI